MPDDYKHYYTGHEYTKRKPVSIEPLPADPIIEHKKGKLGKRERPHKACVTCEKIPTFKAIFDLEGATLVERYCDTYIKLL